jgi:hypothetical protein
VTHLYKPSISVGDTKLSNSVTVDRYKQLEKAEDKAAIAAFIVERFDERYFAPVMNPDSKHGFTMLAVGCLVIEALESFYQGLEDTKGSSSKMFCDFFARDTPLKPFGRVTTFYSDIRCGILHQAEVRGGWRITRKQSAPLLDEIGMVINAELFIQGLKNAVSAYARLLLTDPQLWANFKNKMRKVCENCERNCAGVLISQIGGKT